MNLCKTILLFSLLWSYTYANSLRPMLSNGTVTNHYAVQIYYDTEALRLKIITTFEPLESKENLDYIVVEVDEEEHQKLLDLELIVKIDTHFTEKINTLSDANMSIRATSGTHIPDFPCYRTVEETFSSAETIVSNYPMLAQWIDVGDSWKKENDLGGYDMNVLKITNFAQTQKKPALFITSSIHAREYAPAELATRFAEYLVSNYGTDADITWMLDYHEVHLMLMANPDGRKHAEKGLYWRKNVNDDKCQGTRSGIDLNRNFDFRWNCCGGSSNNECSETYHGTAPASEPETQAIQTYMKNLFGDHRATDLLSAAPLDTSGIYLDIHSYSKLILWPWGTSDTVAPNNMVTLGRKFAYSNSYTPKQSIGLYATDGTTGDYGYGELGIPSYTFELGTSFFQDCSTFNNTIVPDNMPSLLYALKAVRRPYTLPLGPEVVNLELSTGTAPVPKGNPVTLTAIVNDTLYNHSNGVEPTQNISQAEYYIDIPPWVSGAHAISINAQDANFNSSVEAITKTIDTSSLNEGNHTIFVRAKDADNHWGVISAIFLTITAHTQTSIIAPTDLEATNITSNSATLSWTDNSDNEAGFVIYRGTTLVATLGANIQSYALPKLTAGTTYIYSVRAFNSVEESAATTTNFKTKVTTVIPDYEVALALDKTTFIKNTDDIFIEIRVTEIKGGINTKNVIYTINKNENMSLNFSDTLSRSPSGKILSNKNWTLEETVSTYKLTYVGTSSVYPIKTRLYIGLTGTYTPPSEAKGKFTFKIKLRTGSGDINTINNEDSDALSYVN